MRHIVPISLCTNLDASSVLRRTLFLSIFPQISVLCLYISMEEAKKNMYAFSTTTYTGFQCTVDEATSEKFKGNV